MPYHLKGCMETTDNEIYGKNANTINSDMQEEKQRYAGGSE